MNAYSNPSSHRRRKLIVGGLVAATLAGGAFALAPSKQRPVGATLSYVSTIQGVGIEILHANDHTGSPFSHPGSFGYSAHPELGGKTMGSAPREYGLPIWVEFEWREPTDIVREEGETYEEWGARVDEDTRKLRRKKERVYVASKIPHEAIDEVRQAQAETTHGKLPNKMLWLFFVWTPTGIKVRWEIYRAYPGRRTPWQGDPLE